MWTGVQFTGTLGPSAAEPLVHVQLAGAWHVVWYMMPTSPQVGRAAARLGRRGRAGERDAVHLLDHGQEPDGEPSPSRADTPS